MFLDRSGEFSEMQGSPTTSLAELMGAFSYALDLTEGQPEGHSIRSCYIANRLAAALGLGEADRRTVYYATMLKDLGCSSNAARIAEIYLTDDRSFKHDFKLVGQGLGPILRFVFSRTGPGHPLARRAGAIANILRNGSDIARSLIETRCTRGADIARMLRFPEPVPAGIAALDEHWDGSGKPLGLSGDAIPLAARIGVYCDALADRFGITGPARRSLRRSANLHDVGKLAVSSTVLEKPGKLDDAEWEVMRSHAGHTTTILSRIAPLRDMAVIAGSHHERLDGKGYPLSLTAPMISIEARIISVCDFYDALIADRPYRDAMPQDKALAIMAGEVGTAIDPACFAALREVVAAGHGALALPRTPANLLMN